MIFTSNYARHGQDPNAVAISAITPSWYTGKVYSPLAPSWEIIKAIKSGKITNDEYTILYLKLLKERQLTAEKVLNDLGENAILLCYESPGTFCHRRIVANWIQEQTGFEVPELSLYNKNSEIINDAFDM